MVIKPLSNELISLINYVELNKSGWWKKATSQIIMGFLWEIKESISAKDLHRKISEDLNLNLPIENITSQLDYLISGEKIVKLEGGYRITESERKTLNVRNKISLSEDAKVEAFFKALILKESDFRYPADDVWKEFKAELVKSVKRIGANTYTFLNNGTLHNNHDWLNGFLSKYNPEQHGVLRNILNEFFNPNIDFTRGYILRLLNAYFFVEATQLKKDTIKILEKTKKQREVKIILDTNFVFSVLGLHENPADDSAASLLSLSEKIGNVKISYYILPTTLDEIKKVISYQVERLKRYRYSPNLSKAVLKSGLKSSIAIKYFSACANSSEPLSPDSYFLPYTDGLLRHLESRNIKILEWPTVHYPTEQRVVDDQVILWRKEQKKPEDQRKRYEAIEHDLIFWHIIKDHRNEISDSPLDENYWGVTIDWSMIQFDQVKRRTKNSALPVVLHPTNLVQLLQFWIPRDETLESGILETMRLPLFFNEFDAKDEKVTIEIIQALSTFKNINNIDIEVLSSMLADKALKQKISENDIDNEEVISLIESEFALQANTYKILSDSNRAEAEEANKKLASFFEERKTESEKAENELLEKDAEIKKLQSKLKFIEDENFIKVNRVALLKNKLFFFAIFFILPVILFFIECKFFIPLIKHYVSMDFAAEFIFAGISSYVILIFFSMLSSSYCEKHPILKEWVFISFCKNIYTKIIVPLVIASAAFKDEIAEVLKSLH